jgi:hypothetical protein
LSWNGKNFHCYKFKVLIGKLWISNGEKKRGYRARHRASPFHLNFHKKIPLLERGISRNRSGAGSGQAGIADEFTLYENAAECFACACLPIGRGGELIF